jgi:hypothetical protein
LAEAGKTEKFIKGQKEEVISASSPEEGDKR